MLKFLLGILLGQKSVKYIKKLDMAGIEHLKMVEGYRNKAYKDSVGILTIGFGTSRPIFKELTGRRLKKDTVITEAEGERLIHAYFKQKGIYKMIKTDNQQVFNAICSFTYNVGKGALNSLFQKELINKYSQWGRGSKCRKYKKAYTLRQLIEMNDLYGVANCLSHYGKPKEIRARRQKEIDMILRSI